MSAGSDSAESARSAPPVAQRRKIRPLEIFLIIVTCGLYGLVLWARQRKPRQGKYGHGEHGQGKDS